MRKMCWPRRAPSPTWTPPADPALVWLEAIEHRLRELATPTAPTPDPALAALPPALAALEKQISRAGREQLKANSLAEAQLAQLTAALDALRAADARRDT